MTLPGLIFLSLVGFSGLGGKALAQEYVDEKAELERLLSGATLAGTYLRTGSDYELEFQTGGSLTNQRGESGRWWVSETGRYCREWLDGRMAGHTACMKVARSGNRIFIYSNGTRVAEGALTR